MNNSLEKSIKKAFSLCGLEISRKEKKLQRTNLGQIIDHIVSLGFRPNMVIDVGVAYGTPELYEKFASSRFLLIEPVKEWEGTLKNICSKYSAEYVLAAAGDKPGEAIINVHADLSGNSIFKETDGSDADGTPRKVTVVTIDDLCSRKKFGPYLLKIDVQGAELLVLAGAVNTLKETEVIICEVSFFQFYKSGPQFYDVVRFMKEHGFVVYDIFDINHRPFDRALAQADLVFVKENGRFRKHQYYSARAKLASEAS